MKLGKWFYALMLLFVPFIAAAQMQPSERIVTKVPFSFMIGDVTVPAGECTVQLADDKGWVLIVGNRDAKVSVYTIANAAQGKTSPYAALMFTRYTDRYFLQGVKIRDSNTIYTFAPSKLEKELRAQNVPATTELLVASK